MIILYIVTLLIVSSIALYDWMYLKELRKATSIIGISAPPYIFKLLKATLILTVCTIVLLFIFIMYELFT